MTIQILYGLANKVIQPAPGETREKNYTLFYDMIMPLLKNCGIPNEVSAICRCWERLKRVIFNSQERIASFESYTAIETALDAKYKEIHETFDVALNTLSKYTNNTPLAQSMLLNYPVILQKVGRWLHDPHEPHAKGKIAFYLALLNGATQFISLNILTSPLLESTLDSKAPGEIIMPLFHLGWNDLLSDYNDTSPDYLNFLKFMFNNYITLSDKTTLALKCLKRHGYLQEPWLNKEILDKVGVPEIVDSLTKKEWEILSGHLNIISFMPDLPTFPKREYLKISIRALSYCGEHVSDYVAAFLQLDWLKNLKGLTTDIRKMLSEDISLQADKTELLLYFIETVCQLETSSPTLPKEKLFAVFKYFREKSSFTVAAATSEYRCAEAATSAVLDLQAELGNEVDSKLLVTTVLECFVEGDARCKFLFFQDTINSASNLTSLQSK